MKKFRGKYRIDSIRAQWWDYGWNGAYFITICTKNRKHYFGEIKNSKMILSHLGITVDVLWHTIPNYAKYLSLGEFVIMPNHLHGILMIDKPDDKGDPTVVQTGHALSHRNQSHDNPGKSRFQNQGKNTISSIVGSYKSAVTKHANRLELENGWQQGFHDNIIRTHQDYIRIENYIYNNPKNWKDDGFY